MQGQVVELCGSAEVRKQGDHVDVKIVSVTDHFDIVDPQSKALGCEPELDGGVGALQFEQIDSDQGEHLIASYPLNVSRTKW